MQAMPLFLGACALASIAGVVSGTAIDTHPIQRGGIGLEEIARPAIDFASNDALSEQVALPDHYAINTPDGRFDVPQLASRGIYAQRRFAWRDAAWTLPVEQAFPDESVTSDTEDRALDVAETAQANLDQAGESGQAPADAGEAQVIDVGAVLAQR